MVDVGCTTAGCVGFVKPPRLTVGWDARLKPPVAAGCAVVCPGGFVKLKPLVAVWVVG